jgi:hypothetical protein
MLEKRLHAVNVRDAIIQPTEDLRNEVRETVQRLRKTSGDAQRAIEKTREAVEATRRLKLSGRCGAPPENKTSESVA